ncbi:MAG: hypothetical protein WBR18_08780 [Anaerolineales bacterium]
MGTQLCPVRYRFVFHDPGGGVSWQEVIAPPGPGSLLLTSAGAENLWVVQAGFKRSVDGQPNLGLPVRVSVSFDGSNTWTTRQLPLPPGASPVELQGLGSYLGGVGNCAFISPVYSTPAIWKLALTCQDGSWLYTTANQGDTWNISPMAAGLDAQLDFIDPVHGWLFVGGFDREYQGDLHRTTDGGGSWSLMEHTDWGDVRVSFLDEDQGWLLACRGDYCYQDDIDKALLMTADGGKSWQDLEPRLLP